MEKLKKYINKETINYLIFGVLTTLVDFVTYFFLTKASVNYLKANVLSWIAAFLFAFITNKIIVFNSKSFEFSKIIHEFFGFLTARLSSLLFSLVFIYISVTVLHSNDYIAKVLSCIFVVIINYVFSKFLIFNEKDKKSKTFYARFKDNFAFILSFLIPLVILIIIYRAKNIYPWGDSMYLRSDCYHQYAPFMREFYNKIVNGGSFKFSWNIGMGVNFSALYAYYLASPLNWFIALFSKKNIPEIMNGFIVIKTALSSLTFAIYLSKHFKTRKITIATLSVFYALNSYFCAFSWNLMWLDCLVLLPLIVLGIEKLVKENRCYVYCISLGLAILSNYYIAIMICIFCVLYFGAMVYSDTNSKSLSYYFERIKNFTIFSLLAGGFAAVTFLPAYYALSSTASGDFDFPKTVITYFSALFMLSRSLINVDPAIFSAHDPNIYCSVVVFLLVPLYVVNPKINYKEKLTKVSIICFLLFSFNTNIPNYIWHGFHYPNSLPCRESFLYIFMVLAMSYEALHYLRDVSKKQLYGCFAGAIALILLIEQLFVSDTYKAQTIYISLAFLIFYLLVFSLYRNTNYKQGFVVYLMLVIVVCESYINTEATGLSTCTRSAYLADNSAIERLIKQADSVEGNNFYRTEKAERRSKNDAAWSDYHGISIFSSAANSGLSEYFGALGFEESTNAYANYGYTPLTEAMFGVKYLLSPNKLDETEFIHEFSSTSYKNYLGNDSVYYMYENNYSLPLGFMLPENLEENFDTSDPNPFNVQNSLAAQINGVSASDYPMYSRLPVTTVADSNDIYLEKDTHLFIYVTTSLDSIKVSKSGTAGGSSKMYYSMTHSHILDLGEMLAGTKVSVTSTDSKVSSIQLYAYSFDKNVFLDAYDKLNKNTLNVSSYTDTTVNGTITADQSGLLYFSIPYDKGFSVYVDGKKIKTHAFKDALLSVYLNEGTHDIRLEFNPVGLDKGILLSLLSVIAFIGIVILDIRKKKSKKDIKDKE